VASHGLNPVFTPIAVTGFMKPTLKMVTLKELLAEWQDFDAAAYKLACCLGILPPDDGSTSGFGATKHLFWGANVLGESLGRFLDELVKCEVLEFDDKGTNLRYRWNPKFVAP